MTQIKRSVESVEALKVEHPTLPTEEAWNSAFIIAYATWAKQMMVNKSPKKYRRRLSRLVRCRLRRVKVLIECNQNEAQKANRVQPPTETKAVS